MKCTPPTFACSEKWWDTPRTREMTGRQKTRPQTKAGNHSADTIFHDENNTPDIFLSFFFFFFFFSFNFDLCTLNLFQFFFFFFFFLFSPDSDGRSY